MVDVDVAGRELGVTAQKGHLVTSVEVTLGQFQVGLEMELVGRIWCNDEDSQVFRPSSNVCTIMMSSVDGQDS